MAKKVYAEVIKSGVHTVVAIKAKSENEARFKLETLPEYKNVSDIIDVSYNRQALAVS